MKKEKCANCGGILVSHRVEYEKIVGKERILFEDVPAQVCSSCDEVWLDGKTAEKIERLFKKKINPTRRITIPVWSLSKAG